MRRGYREIEQQPSYPVFFAELKSDLKDKVSGTSPTVTGSMSTFDPNKGLYFNGSSGLKWSFNQLSFDPTKITIDTSFTILLDYNRNANSGHDWFIVIGTDSNKQLLGFVYDTSSKSIDLAVNKQYPNWTSTPHRTDYTALNTQYMNSGFTYNGKTHLAQRIINGELIDSFTITSFPTLTSSMYLYIGQSSYSGDKMNGYLKNVRVYLEDFNEQMIL